MREHLILMNHWVKNLHKDMVDDEIDEKFSNWVKNISNNINYILNLKKNV